MQLERLPLQAIKWEEYLVLAKKKNTQVKEYLTLSWITLKYI